MCVLFLFLSNPPPHFACVFTEPLCSVHCFPEHGLSVELCALQKVIRHRPANSLIEKKATEFMLGDKKQRREEKQFILNWMNPHCYISQALWKRSVFNCTECAQSILYVLADSNENKTNWV